MHGLDERRVVDCGAAGLAVVVEFALLCVDVFCIGVVYVESNTEAHAARVFGAGTFSVYDGLGAGCGCVTFNHARVVF